MSVPPKVSSELLDLLNESIARELQVSVQYMWQHVQMTGVEGYVFAAEMKQIAIVEMKHAEDIAERLVFLGGKPTTKPTPIVVGENFAEMIKKDIADEEGAIELYRKVIEVAERDGDIVTRNLFERIIAEEEEHHDTFSGILEKA